jgi:hypothetical protein
MRLRRLFEREEAAAVGEGAVSRIALDRRGKGRTDRCCRRGERELRRKGRNRGRALTAELRRVRASSGRREGADRGDSEQKKDRKEPAEDGRIAGSEGERKSSSLVEEARNPVGGVGR